jgi:hypothetical protein
MRTHAVSTTLQMRQCKLRLAVQTSCANVARTCVEQVVRVVCWCATSCHGESCGDCVSCLYSCCFHHGADEAMDAQTPEEDEDVEDLKV